MILFLDITPLPKRQSIKKREEKKKKEASVWFFHGHQATLHTTFVDVCMHVHVSCQPASHQVLMRPAGSVLGPNQTGETAQSWLRPPRTPHFPEPPAHPASPPHILEDHGPLSTHTHTEDLEMASVFVKISWIPRSGPELESPLLLRPASPVAYTLQCFCICSDVEICCRTAERRRYTPRRSQGNIVPEHGN